MKIQKHMDTIHPPSEIGRIPHKIDIGEEFSNLTANEWKNFFLIYDRVILWDFLGHEDRKILDYGLIEMEMSKKIFFVIYMMVKFGRIFQMVKKCMTKKRFQTNKNFLIKNMQMIIWVL